MGRAQAVQRMRLDGNFGTGRFASSGQALADPATDLESIQTVSILHSRYNTVRSSTRELLKSLSSEDQMVQSCADASPTKWHQAHTTWFFETFVLRPFLADYKPYRDDFHRLFNSYYTSLGEEIPEKKSRSLFSRPSLDEVIAFRTHVDAEMRRLLATPLDPEICRRIVLGLNHEQQHQELALTDIKHAFFTNPLCPTFATDALEEDRLDPAKPSDWTAFEGGLMDVGCSPRSANVLDFCFDNECPQHAVYLRSFEMANRLVTCREYLGFMSEGGYARSEFWLSDGWDLSKRERWIAPLYWERDPGDEAGWQIFTLRGWQGLSKHLESPVRHVSFYEADAYARWRDRRLPTEAEWESVASKVPPQGNFLDSGRYQPVAADGLRGIQQMFGDCWEWTASPYVGYPGYRSLPGALGEYNGKFMSGQMILRGGSCVTPEGHVRPTYRNFFPPSTRWQFTGIRLAN